MSKLVLDVGNCGPDHWAIRSLVENNFDAKVVQSHGLIDTLRLLRERNFDLVLVNRKLDQDYSDGLEIIRQIKAEADLQHVPTMLITNYADHQQLAVAHGALYGFGKLELDRPETLEKLASHLTG